MGIGFLLGVRSLELEDKKSVRRVLQTGLAGFTRVEKGQRFTRSISEVGLWGKLARSQALLKSGLGGAGRVHTIKKSPFGQPEKGYFGVLGWGGSVPLSASGRLHALLIRKKKRSTSNPDNIVPCKRPRVRRFCGKPPYFGAPQDTMIFQEKRRWRRCRSLSAPLFL